MSSSPNAPARESIEYDVVIVGGGPAGLSAAIRLKQLAAGAGVPLDVCVLEKGSEAGAHILSGAVMDPRALTELIPDWKARGAPLNVQVTEDRFVFLTGTGQKSVPPWLLPDNFKNDGNYVVSLANVTRWLSQQAEDLGVEIFAGFPAADIVYDDSNSVKGVTTGDFGVGKDGLAKSNFQAGMELHGKYTLFCEGARGHLGRQLATKYGLNKNIDPQVYSIGIKEIWEIDASRHEEGLVMHTAGWPLDAATYGGSFLYHMDNNQIAIGLVVGLGYSNPYLSPFEEFQRYKTHPEIRRFLEGGKRISYGARAITAGGLVSLPRLVFPGGALVGDEAGFLNVSRIKGSHAAVKSGMLVAEATFEALQHGRTRDTLEAYPKLFKKSWLYSELYRARNFKQWMSKNLYLGSLMVGVEQKLLKGRVPWTLHHQIADYQTLKPASKSRKIDYPKPDGKLTFDRLSSVYLSNTNHEENQVSHLRLKDESVPESINLNVFAGPESRYCPAAVYEFVREDDGRDRLVINAQNCVHCKTCDIKDPTQNIVWTPPEGGGGPNYQNC
jgi:electron-transferring-flavoprotein dehydrogenase